MQVFNTPVQVFNNNNNNNAGMAFSDSVVYVVELVLFCDFCYAYRSCQLLLSGKLNL